MSFFNPYPLILINQKIAELDAKLNTLDNYNFESVGIGNYKLKDNPTTDTLDIEYTT
jgi:hypothetical protein